MLSVVLGTTLGIVSGFFGGWVDAFLSRLMDNFLAFPLLVFVIARTTRAAVALVTVAVLGLSACGSDSDDGGGAGEPQLDNGAVGRIFEESDAKGGTLKFGKAGEWGDNTIDPGNTYHGYSWDMLRNFGRTLTMFKSEPGKAGLEVVPDLATDLGKSSDGGKTWAYTLQEGLKFEDGSPITSKDVAYAVLRSMDKTTFKTAPTYFRNMLDITMCNKDEGTTKNCYDGPYRTPKFDTSSAVTTPDDKTIVFHLKEPFAGFDYMAQLPQTVPVPKAKDTGPKYTKHVVSSGPYMFDGEFDPATGFKLVRNSYWDAATDPNRRALPDEMTVKLGMQPDDLDNQVMSNDIDIDIEALGVRSVALTKVLQDESLQKRADNPTNALNWYTSINPTVKPLENIDCRKAIVYAMNPTSYQNAYGGKFAGGEIATTLLPPMIPGYQDFDLYRVKDNPTGQPDKAKESLKACGKPDGFEINMGFRSERPAENATAKAFQEALRKVGIKVTPKPYPDGDYFPALCGKPDYVVKNNLGLCTNGWQSDWPEGFGFLSQIVDSRVIQPTGGSSNTSVRIPEVDKMLDKAKVEQDTATREEMWGEIDKRVMEEAVIYPGVYGKVVAVRSDKVTNVFVNESIGYYDYTAVGVKQ